MEDRPGRRVQDDGDAVRDRVRHPDELDLEGAELERLAVRVGLAQLGGAQQAVLVQLRLHEPEGEPRRDDLLDVDLAKEVRQPADVILVPVREDDCAQATLALAQVREVGEDEVDAEVLVARERESCVDDHRVVSDLEDGHVLPDLAEPAERDDPAGVGHWPSSSGAVSASRIGAKRVRSGSAASSAVSAAGT